MTVKEARNAVGMTQKGLSEWLGIPRRTIEDWDSGKSHPKPWIEKLLVDKILSYKSDQPFSEIIKYQNGITLRIDRFGLGFNTDKMFDEFSNNSKYQTAENAINCCYIDFRNQLAGNFPELSEEELDNYANKLLDKSELKIRILNSF